MRDLDHDMGGKTPRYDATGRWTGPQPAYEGWRPGAEEFSSWWLVLACAIVAGAALWGIGR